MSSLIRTRPRRSALVLVALLVALCLAAPTSLRPAPASAQGITCGGVFFPNATYCGETGSPGVTCAGVYYPTQTACSTSPGITCGGIFFPNATYCGNTGSASVSYTICPDGSQVPIGQNCPQTTVTCPDGSIIPVGGTCPLSGGTVYCNGVYVAAGTCTSGFSVTYPAGWNLVGGPTGTVLTGVSGLIYTLSPGAAGYTALPASTPLQGGSGYWVYFPVATTVTLPAASTSSTAVTMPAGPFVLIGNPTDSTVTVSGFGAVVLTYDPTSGTYTQTSQLLPGQGAWAASPTGGQLIIGAGAGYTPGPAGGPPPPPPPPPPLAP